MYLSKFYLKIPFDLFLCFVLSLPINKSISITSPPSDKTSEVNIVRDGRESGKKQARLESVLVAFPSTDQHVKERNFITDSREQRFNPCLLKYFSAPCHQILAKSAPQKARNRDKTEFATKVRKSS